MIIQSTIDINRFIGREVADAEGRRIGIIVGVSMSEGGDLFAIVESNGRFKHENIKTCQIGGCAFTPSVLKTFSVYGNESPE